jgi:hypothetical protein
MGWTGRCPFLVLVVKNSLADVLAWRLGDFGNVSQSNNFSTVRSSAGGNDHDLDQI